ncbi:hypothetical protein ACM0P6_12410 [Komagataeibacter sucrofermentans]|uniref:hypothetical protein n=1 Tax=Komagataeibacter sucrofermentans TaxID=1053551 RepID=UPI001FC926BB|nr:hypothetical protein [Komagataeibacter sucrofermentans]
MTQARIGLAGMPRKRCGTGGCEGRTHSRQAFGFLDMQKPCAQAVIKVMDMQAISSDRAASCALASG